MKKFIITFLSILTLMALLSGCMLQFPSMTEADSAGKQEQEAYLTKLQELVELLDTVYVDGYDTQELGDYLAAAAVQASGDRWSYYISAEEYQSYLEDSNNEYVGIGVTVQLVNETDEGITIIEVNRGGSAHEAGLLPQDMIIAVNGEPAVEIGVEAMSDRIRGEEGTELTLTMLRDGEYFDVVLKRKLVEVEIVTSAYLDGVGYIKIDNFQAHSAERSIEAIESLLEQGAESLIFDLRYNPGGRKIELVKLLDYLLPEGELFRAVDYNGKENIDYSDAETYLDIPMIVMVNEDSYSAAEFFAAALQEYEWAKVVGMQTVGKGNYQQTFQLSDGSAVAISTGHYSTPKGVNLEGVGVTPDVSVSVDEETYIGIYLGSVKYESDPQLQAAIELLAE